MYDYDTIVVGGGVNSLICASILSKSGQNVLLLESRASLGGLASTNEFSSGFQCNLIYDYLKSIDSRVLSELELLSHGLSFYDSDLVKIALDENQNHICFYKDPNKTANSIKSHSINDAEQWPLFLKQLKKTSAFLEKLYHISPPAITNINYKEIISMKSLLSPLWKFGTTGLIDFIRTSSMMMPELMNQWFEADLLRGAISASAIHSLAQGPYAAATGFNLLHNHTFSDNVFNNSILIKGGTQQLIESLKKSAESNGVKIKTNTTVSSINIKDNSCLGVSINNNQILKSNCVVSGLDPKNTFLNLIDSNEVKPSIIRQIRNIKFNGCVSRLHFILKKCPDIKNVSSDNLKTIFTIAPSIRYLEKASDAVKYKTISDRPYIEFTIPSILNDNFSINNHHVLSATVQYSPYQLKSMSWNQDLNKKLKNNVIESLSLYIPNFKSIVESCYVLSPLEIEKMFGLTEGNLNHGEMTLNQLLFMRPTISSPKYSTPIKSLYLCGPGTHPGGGLHGSNGYNAARELLKNEIF